MKPNRFACAISAVFTTLVLVEAAAGSNKRLFQHIAGGPLALPQFHGFAVFPVWVSFINGKLYGQKAFNCTIDNVISGCRDKGGAMQATR